MRAFLHLCGHLDDAFGEGGDAAAEPSMSSGVPRSGGQGALAPELGEHALELACSGVPAAARP
ncbi:hypothetical protein K1T35_48095 (plasmid) [Pseudonocardia sp. DSM 110487]|uniref:hypothetical protein n=1 Tax=Pseudonocardia sp. DSM 110487 TaxID=2865833 RepID=UPI001C69BE69|nr:hypothetical protein [Pseudonocardia sp. DSM 110487]QYN41111.1 hypothetical protein K1T35_48095 [Pseudonocardia sp. DSM 110487]